MAARTKKASKEKSGNVQSVIVRPEPERVLYKWKAKARPFKKRNRDFWVSVFAIAAVVGFIAFIIETTMVVILIIAVTFLYYIFNTVEPDVIEYTITNKNIKIAEENNSLNQFRRFWFGESHGDEVLVLEKYTIPNRLELVISSKDKPKIRKELTLYIPEEKATPDRAERAANWFSKKVPANN